MNYRRRPLHVLTFQFEGTEASAEAAGEWLSSHDLENIEVSWQGDKEPYALDLITEQGLRTLEAGDWLVLLLGRLYVEDAEAFAQNYEEGEL